MRLGKDQGCSPGSAAARLALKAAFGEVVEGLWDGVVIVLLNEQIKMSQLQLVFREELDVWVAVREQQSTS